MTRRLYHCLYRLLFPKTARAAELVRAARLREANRKAQEAMEKRRRQEEVFKYLDSNVRYLEDVPDWEITKDNWEKRRNDT